MFAWLKRDTRLQSRLDLLADRIETLAVHMHTLQKLVDSSSPAILRADLDDLRGAVDIDRIAHRKQLGKIWRTIGHERDDSPAGISAGGTSSGDSELDAYVELQRMHGGT